MTFRNCPDYLLKLENGYIKRINERLSNRIYEIVQYDIMLEINCVLSNETDSDFDSCLEL